MAIRLITPPDAEPVSLVEAKRHLRVDHTDDGTYIDTLITVARQSLDGREGLLGRALMPQTWELVLDGFPRAEILLPLGPVVSVTRVAYDDPDGFEQMVAVDDYALDNTGATGWLMPSTGGWPTTLSAINAVRILYVAGYAGGLVPAPIKHAILLIVGQLYASRGERVKTDLRDDPTISALVSPYRMLRV